MVRLGAYPLLREERGQLVVCVGVSAVGAL